MMEHDLSQFRLIYFNGPRYSYRDSESQIIFHLSLRRYLVHPSQAQGCRLKILNNIVTSTGYFRKVNIDLGSRRLAIEMDK